MKVGDWFDMMTAVKVGTENANRRSGGTVPMSEYTQLRNAYDETFRAFKELYDEREKNEARISSLESELASAQKELSAWHSLKKRQDADSAKALKLMERLNGVRSRPPLSSSSLRDDAFSSVYSLFCAFFSIYDAVSDCFLSSDPDCETQLSLVLETEVISALLRGFTAAINELSESDALCRQFSITELYPLSEDGDPFSFLLARMKARISEMSRSPADVDS